MVWVDTAWSNQNSGQRINLPINKQINKPLIPGTTPGGSWGLDVTGGSSTTIVLSFIYNSAGVFLVYNRAINVAAVFVANTALYAIVNTSTGTGIVSYFKLGQATYVNFGLNVSNAFQMNDLNTAVTSIVQTIGNVASIINQANSLSNSMVFSSGTLIQRLAYQQSYTDVFAGKDINLPTNIINSLGSVVNSVSSRYATNPWMYNPNLSCLNFLIGILGTRAPTMYSYKEVIGNQAVKGFSYPNGKTLFSNLYVISLYTGGVLDNSITNILFDGLNNLFSFKGVGGVQLFNVSSSSMMIISNAGQVTNLIPGVSDSRFNFGLSGSLSFNAGY